MVISGIHMIDKEAVEMRLLTWLFTADVREEIILSYEWCQLRKVDIFARKHGLLRIKSGQEFGVDTVVSRPGLNVIDRMLRVRDGFFAGASHLSRVCRVTPARAYPGWCRPARHGVRPGGKEETSPLR